ncbi:MAG: hypothetical protein ABJ242_06150 [Marinomonas sp.]|uniref:hypothetical protein n=1 Tax=Parasphingorhabdus sp. TaxID=2709688 RepID=UPI00328D9FC9
MLGYAIVAVVAIVIWQSVQKHRQGSSPHSDIDASQNQALFEAEQERDELRERVKVLERIVTDSNTPSAKKIQKLSDEIEQLRDDTK